MDLNKLKDSKHKYSPQACALLKHMPEDFPLKAFEKWVEDEVFVIGSNYIPAFLEAREKAKERMTKAIIEEQIPGLPKI